MPGANASGNYIVVSVRPAQSAETVNTMQGSGLTAVSTDIIDGQRQEITVEEDLSITPPPVSTLVTLTNVFLGAGAGGGNTIAPFGNSAVNTGTFKVESNDFSVARKEVGTRVFLCRAYAAINACNGGGNPAITLASPS